MLCINVEWLIVINKSYSLISLVSFLLREKKSHLYLFFPNTEFRKFTWFLCIINNLNKISSYWCHLCVVTSQNSKRIQNSMLCIKVAWIFCHQQKFNRLFCSFFFSSINIRIIIQELRIIWYKNYQRVVHYKIKKDAGALIAKGSDTESPQNGLSLS